jgi:periplasmic protein TonB
MFDNMRNMLDFDDLLFEKRNREYGAYQLRKRYNRVITFSVLAAVLLFSSAFIVPFLIKPNEDKVFVAGNSYVTVDLQTFEPPPDIYVPPAAPPPTPPKVQEVVKYNPPVIVDSILPIDATLPTFEESLEIHSEEIFEYSGTGSGDDLLGLEGGTSSDNPFMIVETMPSFRGGGLDKFRDWVQKRTNYPSMAIEKKIKGKVILTFIVETDGSVSNVTVKQGVDPLIDIEAVKAIESSPKWTPGFQRGKPVRVRYVIPLNFSF